MKLWGLLGIFVVTHALSTKFRALAVTGLAITLAGDPVPVGARNLPLATGATGANRGQAVALAPIVALKHTLDASEMALPDLMEVKKFLSEDKVVPLKEKEFKRLFDEYSQDVSYKQRYLDSNASVVNDTMGFDGLGRQSIEKEDDATLKQESQFGFRNDAWVAVDEARAELAYQMTQSENELDLSELRGDLQRANAATMAYLLLAPEDQLREVGFIK